MQPIIKIVVAVLVVALIAVIGLIAIGNSAGDKTPQVQATAQAAKTPTAADEAKQEPEARADTHTAADEADNEAPDKKDTAQDETIYEGALAGMTEEEIAQQAMAEEESHGSETGSID